MLNPAVFVMPPVPFRGTGGRQKGIALTLVGQKRGGQNYINDLLL